MGIQRHAAALLAAIFFALHGLVAATFAAEPIKNSACLDCHADKTLTKTNAAGKEVSLLAAIFFALHGLVAATFAAEPIKNSACLDCHADKTLTKTNAAGKEVSLFVD